MAEQVQVVQLETSMGNIQLELQTEKAPLTVENFIKYVKAGFYNGTIFHRVINDFMIQGGGFDKDMKQKKTEPEIPNEAANGLTNLKYTIAMARTSAPHSASSQFFINVKDNNFLNFTAETNQGFGYCVFGGIKADDKASQETVDKIKQVKTINRAGHQDVPEEVVQIIKASVVEEITQ
jgi:peptidyl-prolyl cis-trans isomerase B (cyclophilin B)